MRNYIFLGFFSLSFFLSAAPGDTTFVSVHNNTQMTWYERYNEKALFPDGNKTYHKILMTYTLGCATNGCSDWDYTTRLTLLHPTGILDSNVKKIDTISTSPLVLDTTWNVFEKKEPYELARVITPYGSGLANNWKHDFVYDVTDYYPLLKDSVEIEMFYQGWSSGFSATVTFAFIEGARPREVHEITKLYNGKGNYINSTDFERDHLPLRTVNLNPAATGLELRANFSGHGFVNAISCAEFCNKNYNVTVNGQNIATQAMWRDDCGLNPIFPQGGTWLYDRANWCPGDKSLFRSHDLSSFAGNSSIDLDVNIEAYSYSVPSGEVPANYNYAVHLIQYGTATFKNDVELERIMAPSNEDEFGRINPICGTAVVKIRNKGSEILTSCTFRYGLKGQAWSNFTWNGSLMSMESAIVELPFGTHQDWWAVAGQNFTFEVFAENPNGITDENPINNAYNSTYTAPEAFPEKLNFTLRTNNVGSDTHWSLTTLDGTVIDSDDNLSNNTTYVNAFDLASGCYILSIKDRSKNGLSFFANNDGAGSIQLKNNGGSFFFKNLTSNFGTELKQYFTVGYTIGLQEDNENNSFFEIYPNPAKNMFNIQAVVAGKHSVSVKLINITGKAVYTETGTMQNEFSKTISLEKFASGIYFVETTVGSKTHREKLIIQ